MGDQKVSAIYSSISIRATSARLVTMVLKGSVILILVIQQIFHVNNRKDLLRQCPDVINKTKSINMRAMSARLVTMG